MSLAVGTFPRPGAGRCPALIPPACGSCAWGGGTPNGCLCLVLWVQTPIGGRYEAPGRLAPPAQQPARRRPAFSASWCGGGGSRGTAGPVRFPGGPHCLYASSVGDAGSNRTRGRRSPCWGVVRGGGGSGGQSCRRKGRGGSNRTSAGPSTLRVYGGAQGVLGSPPRVHVSPPRILGPPPGGCWPPPFGSCATDIGVRGERPLEAMTHGACTRREV